MPWRSEKTFQIVDKLLGRNKTTSLPYFTNPQIMSTLFNEFFVTKISNIRTLLATWESSTAEMACPPLNTLLPPCRSKLSAFKPTTDLEVTTIITNSSKASCSLDPIPTNLLCALLPVLVPIITHLVNTAFALVYFHLNSSLQLSYLSSRNVDWMSKYLKAIVLCRTSHLSQRSLKEL